MSFHTAILQEPSCVHTYMGEDANLLAIRSCHLLVLAMMDPSEYVTGRLRVHPILYSSDNTVHFCSVLNSLILDCLVKTCQFRPLIDISN